MVCSILFKVSSNFEYHLYPSGPTPPLNTPKHICNNVAKNTSHFFLDPRFISDLGPWGGALGRAQESWSILNFPQRRDCSALWVWRGLLEPYPFCSSWSWKATLSAMHWGLNNSKHWPHSESDPHADYGVHSGGVRWEFFTLEKQRSARNCA